jgi:CubicO group peptidase (beta-lactamase class C family)
VGALDLTDSWRRFGVGSVAAAVVGPEGVLATHGDQGQVFGLASVTKLLSAYAALVALEEQALELHSPAGPPGATVEHLLAHTAGYGFDSGAEVMAPPGTRRIYSNRGIEELAAHAGRETGIEFGTYLAEAVLEPLGLGATELRGSPAYAAWSTTGDLAVFAQELLRPRLVARSTLAQGVEVHFPGLSGVLPGLGRFDPLDWGLGFERNFGRPGHWAGPAVSPSAFGHFGASGTFLWADPVAGLACVCLTDLDFGDWAKAAWPELGDAVLAEYS